MPLSPPRAPVHIPTDEVYVCSLIGSGPRRAEGALGGPRGVGEGQPALALSQAGPGQAAAPAAPQRALGGPRPRQRAAAPGDAPQLHGLGPPGETTASR